MTVRFPSRADVRGGLTVEPARAIRPLVPGRLHSSPGGYCGRLSLRLAPAFFSLRADLRCQASVVARPVHLSILRGRRASNHEGMIRCGQIPRLSAGTGQ